MKTVYLIAGLFITSQCFSQDISQQLSKAIAGLENDNQFSHAMIGFCVVDGKTGKTVYKKNEQVGLAPASCQKVITSCAAFELLGKNYQYKTPVKIYKEADSVRLFIYGSGDPTLGSWRWPATKIDVVYKSIQSALQKKNVTSLGADISILEDGYSYQPIPDGWVWQDIGNYYGAGARAFNWHENQYDLLLSSGNTEGDLTNIAGFDPLSAKISISNFITTGKKGSGDNAYIYSAPNSNVAFATGTIPPTQSRFVISGSMPDPSNVFENGLRDYLNQNGISISHPGNIAVLLQGKNSSSFETIHTIISPSFDSINYWFLKKSVNLFGEAFVKTIAYEKAGIGSTDTGVNIIRNFWNEKGIDKAALHIIDGSGLSPANRVTTDALVKIMQYAKERPWYNSFYNALPEMNGIKMKDGYIGGVRSYTGYIRSKTGAEYTFSFIVNNYDGNPGTVREKIWKVLDILK